VICRSCPGRARCRDVPTAATAIVMECPRCAGDGCAECDEGRIELVGCPLDLIDGPTEQALRAADLAEHGSWPLAGGWLDQTESCLAAVRVVQAERRNWEARMIEAK